MFTHAHVSMTTYRVDVYRSRPIGASLLTTSPQQGDWQAMAVAGRADGYQCGLDWGRSSTLSSP